jgi:serine/threonine protein kinase
MRVLFCEGCGAPLDAPWHDLVVVCAHCGSDNLPGQPDQVPQRVPADGRPRVNVGGRTYVLESRLGQGESSIVYRARWVDRLGELVVLKVLQALDDADALRNEWTVLRELVERDRPGSDHFARRLPPPVAFGRIETDVPRTAAVYGWRSGFVHTLAEVGRVHPHGVPGEVAVWLLKRLLELLVFVHEAGFVHGAITPEHILVQPRDHGAMLIGWSCATRLDGRARRLRRTVRAWAPLYDGATRATAALDIAMACAVVRGATAWSLPGAMAHNEVSRLLDKGTRRAFTEARPLLRALTEASRETYGPPAHHPLEMPGWRR